MNRLIQLYAVVAVLCLFSFQASAQRIHIYDETGKLDKLLIGEDAQESEFYKSAKPNPNHIVFVVQGKESEKFMLITDRQSEVKRNVNSLLNGKERIFTYDSINKVHTLDLAPNCASEQEYQIVKYQIPSLLNKDTVRDWINSGTAEAKINAELTKIFTDSLTKYLRATSCEQLYVFNGLMDSLNKVKHRIKKDDYHTKAEKQEYDSLLANYKSKIELYSEHFLKYVHKENEVCGACNIPESILAWQLKIDSLERDWEASKRADVALKIELTETVLSIAQELGFEKYFNNLVQQYTNPVYQIMYQGLIQCVGEDEHILHVSYSTLPIANSSKFQRSMIKPLNTISTLNTDSRIMVEMHNVPSAKFTDPEFNVNTKVIMGTAASESELIKNGWVQGINKIDPGNMSFQNIVDKWSLPGGKSFNISPSYANKNWAEYAVDFKPLLYKKSGQKPVEERSEKSVRVNSLYGWGVYTITLKPGKDYQDSLLISFRNKTNKSVPLFADTVNTTTFRFLPNTALPELAFIMISNFETENRNEVSGNKHVVKLVIPWNSREVEIQSEYFSQKFSSLCDDQIEIITSSLLKGFKFHLINAKNTYYDVDLKKKDGFKALHEPKLEFKTNSYKINDQQFKVTAKSNEIKAQDYTFTFKEDLTVGSMQLPMVRKKYMFAVTSGLMITRFPRYQYEIINTQNPNGTVSTVVRENLRNEDQLVPSVFFSWYPRPLDVHQSIKEEPKRLELGIGFDYYDKTILDNVYVGVGYNVHRVVHVMGGFRFGAVQRIDMNEIDPRTVTLSNLDAMRQSAWTFRPSYFLSVNLGIDLLPQAIAAFL